MGKAEEDAKKIPGLIKKAQSVIDVDPKTKTGIDTDYYNAWSKRYQRVHSSLTTALNNLTISSDDGKSVTVNTEMLDLLHANLDRLHRGVEGDKAGESKVYAEFAKDLLPKTKNIIAEFNKNSLLRDVTETKEAFSPQELVDVSNRLLSKFDYVYTQTDIRTLNAGNGYDPLPKRRPGEGGKVGSYLDAMHKSLDVLHDKENDPQNRGIIKDDPLLIGKQLKEFYTAKRNLESELTEFRKSIVALPKNSAEKNLFVEIDILQADLVTFGKNFNKEFEKRIKIFDETPQVKMVPKDVMESGIEDIRSALQASGVSGFMQTSAGEISGGHVPRAASGQKTTPQPTKF